jgi:hypothetical protein
MESLRKIPLDMLIQILEDLYNSGADYVDISGDTDVDGKQRDTIKFTVKPEYLSDFDTIEADDDGEEEEKLEIEKELDGSSRLSDDDINELI